MLGLVRLCGPVEVWSSLGEDGLLDGFVGPQGGRLGGMEVGAYLELGSCRPWVEVRTPVCLRYLWGSWYWCLGFWVECAGCVYGIMGS